MKNQFDELAKAIAQPIGRRVALKTFGFGLGAIALTTLGLSRKAEAVVFKKGVMGGNGGSGQHCIYDPKTGRRSCQPGLTPRWLGGIESAYCVCLH
jgi:hypothetical protein